jgi:hypothetical protein
MPSSGMPTGAPQNGFSGGQVGCGISITAVPASSAANIGPVRRPVERISGARGEQPGNHNQLNSKRYGGDHARPVPMG